MNTKLRGITLITSIVSLSFSGWILFWGLPVSAPVAALLAFSVGCAQLTLSLRPTTPPSPTTIIGLTVVEPAGPTWIEETAASCKVEGFKVLSTLVPAKYP